MSLSLFDSHCHLDLPEFDQDREAILAQCRRMGVQGIVVPGVYAQSWPRLLEVTAQYDMLYPAPGLHPCYVDRHAPDDIDRLVSLIDESRPVAIGEIGLDYYLPHFDAGAQRRFFEAQLDLASRHDLPVILHVRKAHDEVLEHLKRYPSLRGIVHAFGGSEQQAQRYIDMGYCLGLGGPVTYERARRLRRLASVLPLDALVLETDAPDLPLSGHQGERNSPVFLGQIAETIAQLRGEDSAVVAETTTSNVRRILGLD